MSNLNYNRVILAGRLGGDPEVKVSNSGINVVRCTVCVNRPYQAGKSQETDFLRCIAFGKTGEFLAQYFRKGQAIHLEGRIQTGSYTDQQGVKRFTTDIIVDHVDFVDSKAEAQGQTNAQPQQATGYVPSQYYAPAETPQQETMAPVDEETLPF